MDRKRALRVTAPSGAHVTRCACGAAFYSRENGTRCQVCTETAHGATLRTCPRCGYQWDGPGAGVARNACPVLGCSGRV